RYEQCGIEGLKEQSRAPKTCPHRTPEEVISLVIQEKLKNRKRGPRKIRAQLKRQHPNLELPAVSTISYWLKKEGLVEKRKKRLRVPPYTRPFCECKAPNDVWSIDYKGQFYMKNGHVCYPLTISDNLSRFLLGCKALQGPRYAPTKKHLELIFREYGLPDAIRSDNGTPFAGKGIGGLSRLSVWFIQLGITPERIEKGCPEQNGRHERMHRTLKNDVLDSIARNLKEQQKAFDIFRHDFNHNRPHESLNDQTPSEFYKKSNRPYIDHPHMPEYGYDYTVRHVKHGGEIKFKGRTFYVTELLAKQPVGLKEIADGLWQLQYSFYTLGSVDLRKNKIIRN
ncbi:MAG: integrase core domain-containing protein, partial [Candidatus Omnitrophota bacterium]|nr:integrase core domain-containing protein [Candidatus Omnitrophota bacterium]